MKDKDYSAYAPDKHGPVAFHDPKEGYMNGKVDLWLSLDDVGRISDMLDHSDAMGFATRNREQERWDNLYYDLRNAREAYQSAIYDAQRRFQEAQ